MNLLSILCTLLLLSVCSAEEMMFFAEDHYKAVGAPRLEASVVNPVLYPGSNSTLVILLENIGRVDELIPTQKNGSDEDVMKEMREEMRSVDALNVTARLHGISPVDVVTGPQVVALLPSGSVARMEFNISSAGADGWYELPLTMDYEHQVDVMVNNGSVTPLYKLDSTGILIKVFIQAQGVLSVVGAKSDLHPGGKGTILAAIKNYGHEIISNCTVRLLPSPHFIPEDNAYLGNIAPGGIAVAKLEVAVDGNANSSDYNLAGELNFDGGSAAIQIPAGLGSPSNSLLYIMIAALAVSTIVAITVSWRKRRNRPRWRKFSR